MLCKRNTKIILFCKNEGPMHRCLDSANTLGGQALIVGRLIYRYVYVPISACGSWLELFKGRDLHAMWLVLVRKGLESIRSLFAKLMMRSITHYLIL
jgi:hypothetical protein